MSIGILVRTLAGWKITWLQAGLLTFWLAYLGRMLLTAPAAHDPDGNQASLFFVAAVVIPAFAQMVSARYWCARRATLMVATLGTLITFLALALQMFSIGDERNLLMATGRLSYDTVNPITLGHVAVSTLTALWFTFTQRSGPRFGFVLIVIGAATLILLVATGSKGPILALFALLLCGFAFVRQDPMPLALTVTAIGFVLALSIPTLLDSAVRAVLTPSARESDGLSSGYKDSSEHKHAVREDAAHRLINIREDWSTLDRLKVWRAAAKQIRSAPWTGTSYIEWESKSYPHNLFIESGMALGGFGLVLIVILIYCGLRSARELVQFPYPIAAAVFVQFAVSACFSGAIYGEGQLWTALGLLLAGKQMSSATPRARDRRVKRCGEAARTPWV
ncbi:MAG: O-antigen ligase family protein [Gammaproteobacteria bacterium]|nr:O-antigen ligase family protein [Gammaproteobacteria bacterium]